MNGGFAAGKEAFPELRIAREPGPPSLDRVPNNPRSPLIQYPDFTTDHGDPGSPLRYVRDDGAEQPSSRPAQ